MCTTTLICISAFNQIRHNAYYTKKEKIFFGATYFREKLSRIIIDAIDLN